MKVTFPKNIKKGILAGMSFNLGPISLSIIQIFLLVVGIGLAAAVFNGVSKVAGKAPGFLVAAFILVIFIFVAFFKISEMNILEFVAKVIRNKFFDVQKKFQSNFERFNPTEILLKESKMDDKSSNIINKKGELETEKIMKEISENELV